MNIDLHFSLDIQQPNWRTVYTFPQGAIVPKGRTNALYKGITTAAGKIKERYGCYAWGDNSVIFYCGSFADDYSGDRFQSNFQGRIHNYLQNHGVKATGRKNTNLFVFEHINSALTKIPLSLYLFEFNSMHIDDATVNFFSYTADSNLVRAVEQLLICIYRRRGQCLWNRT